MLLAIETSCDETAVSLFSIEDYRAGKKEALCYEVVSSQVKIHAEYGGVVPEIAAREHIVNLPILVEEAFKKTGASKESLRAIAVTRGPGLKGCLLVGVCYAKGLSTALNIPLIALNHLEGHIFAAKLDDRAVLEELPALCLIVSGGHTELVLVEGFREYRVVARTRDDAAGEAFDKIASLLGLPYPGGPALSKCAIGGNREAFTFPISLEKDPASFSFSGLKTAALRLIDELGVRAKEEAMQRDLAASFENAICNNLVAKTAAAFKAYMPKSLILTGGVAANKTLRAKLEALSKEKGIPFYVPSMKWCTDNASMMGVLGCEVYLRDEKRFKEFRLTPDMLGPETPSSFSAIPRWPVEKAARKEYA